MRRLTALFVGVVLMVGGSATAGKIGFVDAERAVFQVGEGQAKVKEFEAWAEPQQKAVEAAAKRVAEIRTQIQQQRSVASPETQERLGREELEARRRFEDAKRNFERDREAKKEQLFGEVAVKVGQVASEYAAANEYDAVFVLGAQPLVYISDTADLTEIVIRLYDERFPVN